MDNYTYDHFSSVYRRACTGGSGACTGTTIVLWSNLATAVNALPYSVAKKAHWTNSGNSYGVNF